MKTIKINFIKIAGLMGLLLSLSLFNYSYAGSIDLLDTNQPTMDANQNITFRMKEFTDAEVKAQNFAGDRNISVQISLIGLELNGTIADIVSTNLSTYFDLMYSSASSLIIFTQKLIIIPELAEIIVSIPVSTTITNGSISYSVALSKTTNTDEVAVAGPGSYFGSIPVIIGGSGGGANPPNYSISMEISGGNNLGTVASKELPLNIAVTNTASAPNTGDVVVALAKDSRIASVGTNCGGDDWALDRTNPVAYLFTYTANDKDFPPTTSASSTIVCPVTVTRPTTQSGKLQLNAVLRHGSGDTKTSNDVASIEVTYN